ncbi:MAG: hypothetical protein NT157_02340 [Candidatus Micrarchaeota archaeon]|nr:hypothetical protein [Candidatus Micrarchaeota archaeon]
MMKNELRKTGKFFFDLMSGWLKRWNEDLVKKRDERRAKLENDAKRLDEFMDILGGLNASAGLLNESKVMKKERIARL